ncbi:MAG TPA: hypothetical protein VF842_08195 [Flavobacterium sp.]
MTHRLLFLNIVVICLLFFSCKTKINQIENNEKEGKWITIDTMDHIYEIRGKYHKGIEKGTWHFFYNGKMVRKEKYKKDVCNTRCYYPNGKLNKKGYTKIESNKNGDHWYYFGNWHYYDEKGRLLSIKTYEKGEIINSLDFIKN